MSNTALWQQHTQLTVWRFSDGTPGHEKQSTGLLQGFEKYAAVRVVDIHWPADRARVKEYWRQGRHGSLAPDLIVGAGHKVHLPMLISRLRCGGRVVLLMRPTLPPPCFDLCLIPDHDALLIKRNVLRTEGMLCPVPDESTQSTPSEQSAAGLMLVGGPSRHFQWDNQGVAQQIEQIVRSHPEVNWTVGNSRRTPEDFEEALPSIANLEFVDWQQTDKSWVTRQLARSQAAWVTADSASMLYEALSADVDVGVLCLESDNPHDKLAQGVERLIARGLVGCSRAGEVKPAVARLPLREHERCARIILSRWFPLLS